MIFNNPTFEKSLKPTAIEEWLDYYFYRRIAYRLIPYLYRLKLSPNQVTTLSLGSGLLASYLVYHHQFVMGAILALIAIFFDCCDGQLARLTGQTHPLGRAMDGTFDAIWITTLWLSIYHSHALQHRGIHSLFLLWLMIFAAISMVLHCWRFDGIKIHYLLLADPSFSEKNLSFDEAKKLTIQLFKKGQLFLAFIGVCMAFQAFFFLQGTGKKNPGNKASLNKANPGNRKILEPIINTWSWLGEGHHNTSVILGLLFLPLTPWVLIAAFAIILIPFNLWWVYCEFLWARGLKKVIKNDGT